MDRRLFGKNAGLALAASLLAQRSIGQQGSASPSEADRSMAAEMGVPLGRPLEIGMMMYPGMVALDFTGPHTFLGGLLNAHVYLLWKTIEPIRAIRNITLMPDTTLADCPRNLDVLFVPGGSPGTIALMQDQPVLDFLADRGSRARYVTSVCTGSLVLGAAGLLKGYRATSHWNTRDLLPLFGAIPVEERVVEDRNRITGGGVTAGIDFGLVLTSRLRDRKYAEMQQLLYEYDPQPPFHTGTPKEAGPQLTAEVHNMLGASHEEARKAAVGRQVRS